MFNFKKRKNEKEIQKEIDIAIGQQMEKYASAQLEHLRSIPELKHISEFKINPQFSDKNYQSQSGFSAEVKQRARYNADEIINGSKNRIERTDNVGSVNHPKYDHVNIDKNGNPILDQNGDYTGGSQQKNFSNIKNYDKLYKKEFEHYRDTPIDVPSDHYDKILEKWAEERENLTKQVEYLKSNGMQEKASHIEEKISKIDDTSKRLRKSKVSSKDAMEARKNYKLSTAKDMGRIAHKAGVQGAAIGGATGAVMSTVTQTKAIINGDVEISDAMQIIAHDTMTSASKSYLTASASSVVGGALKNSSSSVMKSLSKGGGSTMIVVAGASLAKNSYKLVTGEIDGDDFLKNIGDDGFKLASSASGATIGSMIGSVFFPGVGTVVGGLIGGMICSMTSISTYHELMNTIKETEMSDENRKIIAAYCKKIKEEEIEYRAQMNKAFDLYLAEKSSQIKNSFDEMSVAISNGGDISKGLALLSDAFGKELEFKSTEDLGNKLRKGHTLEL